jgi:hypothetical protein
MAVMTKGFLNALAFCCTSTQLDLSTDSATAKHPILQLQIKDKTRCEKNALSRDGVQHDEGAANLTLKSVAASLRAAVSKIGALNG